MVAVMVAVAAAAAAAAAVVAARPESPPPLAPGRRYPWCAAGPPGLRGPGPGTPPHTSAICRHVSTAAQSLAGCHEHVTQTPALPCPALRCPALIKSDFAGGEVPGGQGTATLQGVPRQEQGESHNVTLGFT